MYNQSLIPDGMEDAIAEVKEGKISPELTKRMNSAIADQARKAKATKFNRMMVVSSVNEITEISNAIKRSIDGFKRSGAMGKRNGSNTDETSNQFLNTKKKAMDVAFKPIMKDLKELQSLMKKF